MKAYRIINLEEGQPVVAEAMARLTREIRTAKGHKIRLIKLIHGFGSTGKGGKLRVAARKQLDQLMARGYVKYYVPGERLSIFDEDTRNAMNYCGELRGDSDLERHNNGITIVVL